MKKRIISLVLAMVMALSLCIPAAAASSTQNVGITYRAIKISLNDEVITPCDEKGNTVEPFIMNSNGTTYLPLRAIAQALGLDVKWVAATSTVELTSGGEVKTGAGAPGTTTGKKTVSITYRGIKVMLDGEELNLVNASGDAVEPFIMNGTTYLPLRVVGEALGLEVGWDGKTSTASLTGVEDGAVSSVKLDTDKLWLEVGESYQFNATVKPDDAIDKTISWSSSDPAVATVSSDGIVTMLADGSATITATSVNGKTAKCLVSVPAMVPLFSPDNRVIEVKENELEDYVGYGWSETNDGITVTDKGVYTNYSNTKYDWVFGSDYLYIGGKGATNFSSAPWDKYYDEIYGIYLKYGLTTVDGFAFDGWPALRRVEIPDTVTDIENYAFDDCYLMRIGIPASVTLISNYAFDTYARPASSGNGYMTIYCEEGSAAERWAIKYGIDYCYATIVYFPDGRTCMVSEWERDVYLRNGWYSEPVTILYSADGKEQVVTLDVVDSYLADGWYENKSDVYVTMYALDGRTREVLKINVSAQQKVGWYLYGDYICALADKEITNNGWDAGVIYIEKMISETDKSDADYNKFVAKKDDILAKWRKTVGAPIVITGYYISYNSINVPEVNITFRNISNKTITNLEAFWTCIDSYGNVTADWSHLNGNYNGWMNGISMEPGEKSTYYWTMYSNERTASVRNLRMEKCAFSDGSTWYYGSWYY